ncbi:hypothetical protein JOE59_002766 [Agromyces cerinus]|uniref:hypothetical protein n=1 Tax=Agromyces cerinus TaxID=33878 RepID=UPI00195A136D|nr:hypothetical protein [Agromyces cerinus]MBM7832061.1 hypothetical protein [Agromyces cerinus]
MSPSDARFNKRDWQLLTVLTLNPGASPGEVRMRADMLPPSTWGSNLRGMLKDAAWRKLSRETSEAAGRRCAICGAESFGPNHTPQNPDCHEMWVFEVADGVLVQRLERLVALCKACHNVQHAGRAEKLGLTGDVVDTLCRVNRWTPTESEDDIDRAWDRYELMSGLEFDLDLRALAGRIQVGDDVDLYFRARERERLGNSWLKGPARPTVPTLFDLPSEGTPL